MYQIREEGENTDYTLATEDDEDFRMDAAPIRQFPSGLKKLNFDDSVALSRKSLSTNYDLEDADRLDPTTFAHKGDFIR